jgi:phospholipid N-methyltransferase
MTAPLDAIPQTRARTLEINTVVSTPETPLITPITALNKNFDELDITEEESLWEAMITDLEEQWDSIKKFVSEKKLFLSEFVHKTNVVGAIAPSSSYLADAMTEVLTEHNKPITILEVGAGTGVFTEKIIEKMPLGSTLYVVEIDEHFCKILHEKFDGYQNVQIICTDICKLKIPNNKKCDVIISGLPFNLFPHELVDNILKKYKQLIKRNGSVTYFEYIFIDKLKKLYLLFKSQEIRNEYIQTRDLVTRFKESSSHSQTSVLRNLPPARAITCYPNLPNVTSNPEVAL